MKLSFLITFNFLCVLGTASADVVTGTACSVGSSLSVSDPLRCSLDPSGTGAPSASATITVSQLTPANQDFLTGFTVDVSGRVSAIPQSMIDARISSSAAANVNVNETFLTSGPVREGVLVFQDLGSNTGGNGDFTSQLRLSVGSFTAGCGGNSLCQLVPPNARPLPLTLGTAFNLNLSESVTGFGDPSVEGPGNALGRAAFNFRLFEADGVTPVAFSAVPEPSTLGLLGICCGGLAAYGTRRFKAKQRW